MRQVYRRRAQGRVCPQGKFEVRKGMYESGSTCMEDDRVEKHPASLMRPVTAPLKRSSFKRAPQRELPLDLYLRKLHTSRSSAVVQPANQKPSLPQTRANVYLMRDYERPVGVKGFDTHRVVQCVSMEEEHYLVVGDGSVYTLSATAELSLVQPKPVQLAMKVKVESISCGTDHVAAIAKGNTISRVFGWGSNTCGELGKRDTSRRLEQGVFVAQFDDKFAWTVACGKNSTLVLNKLGQVWGIGSSKAGMLGHGSYEVCKNPVRMVLKSRAKALVCGDTHSVVLLEGGSIVESGSYVGDNEKCCIPKDVWLARRGSGADTLSLSASATSSCTVLDDGTVYAWGPAFREHEESEESPGCMFSYFVRNRIKCKAVCISAEVLAVTSQTGNIYVANLKSNQEGDFSFRVVEYFAKAHIRVNAASCSRSSICAVRCDSQHSRILRLPTSPGRDIGCFALLDQPPILVMAGKPARVRFARSNAVVKLCAKVHGQEAPLSLRFNHGSSCQQVSELTIASKDASFEEQIILTLEGQVSPSAFQPLKRSIPVIVRALVTNLSWRASGQGLFQFVSGENNTFTVELKPELQSLAQVTALPEALLSTGAKCGVRKSDSGRLTFSYLTKSFEEPETISVLFHGKHIPGSPFKVRRRSEDICGECSRLFFHKSLGFALDLRSKAEAHISKVNKDRLVIQCYDQNALPLPSSADLEHVELGLHRLTSLPAGVHKVSVKTKHLQETVSGSPCDMAKTIKVSFTTTTVIEGSEVMFTCSKEITEDITLFVDGKPRAASICEGKGTLSIDRLVGARRPRDISIVFRSEMVEVEPREVRLRIVPLEVGLVQSATKLTTLHRVRDGFYYESELCCLVLDSGRSYKLSTYVSFVKELTEALMADNFLKLKLIKTVAYEAAVTCFPFMEHTKLQALICKYLCDACAVRCAINPAEDNSYEILLDE